MRFFALLVIAMIAAVSAFAPRSSARLSTKSLAMKNDNLLSKIAVPAAMAPFFAPVAAMAAEGTGRAFGIDDGRLVLAALLPSLIIFPLYLQWSSQQDGEDFFDSYERRRSG
mmetsp:Transcript_7139/g.6407  ORF Transcript_7139/g.6407 Transcript_7139/m.6407 type:complete len:112 (-) Transcript_7139:121-456(-)|eukprot:CAMPEP_0196765374 /NCGR_PEP_ID=MMETSP1095-20130614/8394_1 /TAXON_ID=96789 ORGANISM="Chromulina nebulosa, Strain UTEXLB2642" /NCGR_SAMPLE_ID=MMETSP1095 /ASSEMBLY_ACC=CAM_ASM_000446 /LENGTH=111 /DNA_ID=CAMNT_0042123317 /DNA_START=55 /DNA_END=390 /DNA_ORIENTATION=-